MGDGVAQDGRGKPVFHVRISKAFRAQEPACDFRKTPAVDGRHPVQFLHPVVIDHASQPFQDCLGSFREVRTGKRDREIMREIAAIIVQDGQGIPGKLPVGRIGVGNVYRTLNKGLVGQPVFNPGRLYVEVVGLCQTGPAVLPVQEFQGKSQFQFRMVRQVRYARNACCFRRVFPHRQGVCIVEPQ